MIFMVWVHGGLIVVVRFVHFFANVTVCQRQRQGKKNNVRDVRERGVGAVANGSTR